MANERLTNFYVVYNLEDINASTDATFSMNSGMQTFTDVSKLKTGAKVNQYMTDEHNFNILDASLLEMPDKPETFPLFTSVKSKADGTFDVNPQLTIDFSTTHSSYGMVLEFTNDRPLKMYVASYLGNTLLNKQEFAISSNKVQIIADIYNYDRLVIEFPEALPGRYIKMLKISFGISVVWGESNIKSANVVQEIDRSGKLLSIDKLTFEIVDVEDSMNLGNVSGIHDYIQRNQYMIAYETINDEDIFIGKYFLDEFSNTNNVSKFSAQNYVGLLDDIQYKEGRVWFGTNAGEIMEQIFDIAGVLNYTIDDDTYNTKIYGTIQPKTCRSALNDLLFACQSCINATDDNIVVYKTGQTKKYDITRNIKFSTTVTKNKYTHGVCIKYNTYTLNRNVRQQVLQDDYETGTYEVTFTTPYTEIEITGATLVENGPYYVKFTVSTDGQVTITGYGYDVVQKEETITNSYLPGGEVASIETFQTYLCNKFTARTLADKILQFKQHQLTLQIKYLAADSNMDSWHIIQNTNPLYSDYYGLYSKRSIDLTGGFIDNAVLIGTYSKGRTETEDVYYTGIELTMDGDGII